MENTCDFNAEFSTDHYTQKNVEGNLKALVCTKCNNDAESTFDFVTKDSINEIAFERCIPIAGLRATHPISNV